VIYPVVDLVFDTAARSINRGKPAVEEYSPRQKYHKAAAGS